VELARVGVELGLVVGVSNSPWCPRDGGFIARFGAGTAPGGVHKTGSTSQVGLKCSIPPTHRHR